MTKNRLQFGHSHPLVRLRGRAAELWTFAVMWYGVGDLLTTYVGLNQSKFAELNPLIGLAWVDYGIFGLFGIKIVVFTGCYLLYVLGPKPFDIVVPLVVCSFGLIVTIWNLFILGGW